MIVRFSQDDRKKFCKICVSHDERLNDLLVLKLSFSKFTNER
jgi:hypothetical protein